MKYYCRSFSIRLSSYYECCQQSRMCNVRQYWRIFAVFRYFGRGFKVV